MQSFESYLRNNIDALLNIDEDALHSLVHEVNQTIQNGGILWLAGNGGSASTASHASCDLSKGVSLKKGKPIRAFSLMDQIATLTAWANDFSFDSAIAGMCKQYLRKEDLLIVISASGNSTNILNAVIEAKALQVRTASLTGFDGGKVAKISDFNVNISSTDMQVIENAHLVICHWLFKVL